VIADLTNSNPNVLWELGVRHTLSRRAILIAQDKKFLPSDLKDYPIIIYKYKQTPKEVIKFKRDICDKLKDIESDPDKPDSPVAEFLTDKNRVILDYEKSQNYKKLTALVSEISKNLDLLDDVIKMARKDQEIRNKKVKEDLTYLSARCETACLDLLISTNYVNLPHDILKLLYGVKYVLSTVNSKLDCWPYHSLAVDIEKRFVESLPSGIIMITKFLEQISVIRIDYINDNYKEPILPPPILSRPEHQEYVKST
jgi:hypothetical protein